ncbi:FecCD family ABC transporter permease [Haloglycomyces albus]|uniref:FecCD family ABC transporter permease n=1 Tax=Haloglycomyces albus TaxID=526067 RepID=UPI00046D8BC4|nr:iron chelate uptake ABC transporter family permease subunit [Haloglycomyces albus]
MTLTRTDRTPTTHVTVRARSYSLRLHRRSLLVGSASLLGLAALVVFALTSGDTGLGLPRTVQTLLGNGTTAEEFIVHTIRLPRLTAALAVGAALGCAGAIFQSLTRNPLGSPDLLGITSGAGTGAMICIVYGIAFSPMAITLAAGIGALAVGTLIYALMGKGDPSGYRLVLIGLGTAALLTGVNGYLLTKSTDITVASRAVFWLTGDLSGRDWDQSAIVAAAAVVGILAAMALSRPLDGLRYGPGVATGLGIGVRRTTTLALALAALLTAAGVAVAGPLAFVALSAPHIARTLCRGDKPNVWIASMYGAAIVVAADMFAQHAIDERQLPTGVVTGAIGGLYLIWLLIAFRKKGTQL